MVGGAGIRLSKTEHSWAFLALWCGRAVQPTPEKRRALFERSEFARRRSRRTAQGTRRATSRPTIDIGRRSPAFPVTPPYIRIRIRRFGGLSDWPPGQTVLNWSPLAGLSTARFAASDSTLPRQPLGLHPSSVGKARVNWLFSRLSLMSSAAYLPLLTVQAFIPNGTTMPSADSSRPVRTNHSVLSLGDKTDERPPEVSSTAFSARPLDLHPVPLMDRDFVKTSSLVRHGLPRI